MNVETFNVIGDRIERGKLTDEEGFKLFTEFEDQMVKECGILMEKEPKVDKDATSSKNMDSDDPPGEGPILTWQTRVVFVPGGDSWHPKNRKVKLSCIVKDFGLNKHEFVRLRELAGKRYNAGKDKLTIISERPVTLKRWCRKLGFQTWKPDLKLTGLHAQIAEQEKKHQPQIQQLHHKL